MKTSRHSIARKARRILLSVSGGALAVTFLTAGVAWVDGLGVPGFDGREPLTKRQEADAAYKKGRYYYLEGRSFEDKARLAKTPTSEARFLDRARARYRASADAFAKALRRAQSENRTLEYLPELYLEMGDALFKTSQFDAANAAYDNAVEVAPAFLLGHYGRARVRLARGDLTGVQNSYATLLREADTRAEAWSYVDELMSLMAHWVAVQPEEVLSADNAVSFIQWYDEQRAELANMVRWTALESSQ
ncbi:MAG: hypothetical protein AB8G17_21195 [Gammaproteobacteria bacterium]